jgi:hypothetical protein
MDLIDALRCFIRVVETGSLMHVGNPAAGCEPAAGCGAAASLLQGLDTVEGHVD